MKDTIITMTGGMLLLIHQAIHQAHNTKTTF